MNASLSRLLQARWPRRIALAFLSLLILWLVAWLGMPPLLKWQLEKQATTALGRGVTVERVDFRPWSLEIAVEGLRVANAAGNGEQFSLRRFYANAELQSLLRLAPVLDALELEQPRLHVRHLGEGRYDIDDVLQKLRPKDDQPPSDPAQFALFNIKISGGEAVFVDDSVGASHELKNLTVGVPFLSNLPSRLKVVTEPRLAFELNGSPFDSQASTTPFAQTRDTDASVDIPTLDLAPYLSYWPAIWPVKPEAGVLHLALKLAFEQQDTPRLSLSGTAALSGFRVVEKLGASGTAEMLGWDRLALSLNRVEPLAGQVDLAAVELKAPVVSISRDAAGVLNLQRVAQGWAAQGAPAQAAPAPRPPADANAVAWKVSVARLELDGGTVRWNDAALKPATQLALEDVRVHVQGLAWPLKAPAPFEVSALLGKTPLTLKGTATDAQASAQFALTELPLSTFAPYIASVLEPELVGDLAADMQVEWRAAQGDQPMGLKVSARRMDLSEARLGPRRQPLASLGKLEVQDLGLDLATNTVLVGKIALTRPQVRAQRDKEGQWMVDRWMKKPSTAKSPSATAPAPDPAPVTPSPWKVTLADVQIDSGSLALEDLAQSRPVQLDLNQIKVQLKNLQPLASAQPDMPLSVQLRMSAAQGNRAEPGRLSLNGTLRLPGAAKRDADSLRTKLSVQAERLPLHLLEPYFGDRLNLDLLRADTSYRGTVDAALPPAGLRLAVAGNVALDDFAANTLSPAEDLLAWKSLQVRGLKLAMAPGEVTRVTVDETVLSDYFARLIIDETGRINLQGLVKQDGEKAPAVTGNDAPAAAAPSAPAPAATASAPNPDIRFGPISLVNGRVLFSDRFIKPNYSANLSELTGSLSAFASVPPGGAPQMADLTLRGRAEGTAALEIDGKLNPLAQPLALDIRAQVRNLELPPLSPYTVKYAGYGIERGKLSMDVNYKIEPSGQLTASNQIILNQLSFGERVAGSEAPNLPVKLAVALLADRNGVIDINLPVSGSLNDPQFRVAPLIFRLIFNLIAKAITSPFALIGSAFGGGGEEMNQVLFEPGSKLLDAEDRQRLDAVAKALADRPALLLTVVGKGDLEVERSGYQRARLDERVLAEKRRQLARDGAAQVSEAVAVTPAEYPALLKEVYKRADMPKPRNLVGLAKDIPQSEMEALLLASMPVTADAIRELAVARGVAVKDYLASRQLPEDRMFLGAPLMGRQGENWQPQAELKLAPR
ncbi:DUF748 domain-containing protein [Hydrogenophaga sp.]|uniref:DUF748 domain-containing protein n=1 Tax=Hydrogenophaga sp. TaxID=1904254 RepID=UPI0027246738|nr:DUF748 domain-containing protein [Hydrogenophaga sp.]MDO9434353.1 DUF748 domain-containing protein [Hydrogenophaga sp.]